jgi:hypothetical protein
MALKETQNALNWVSLKNPRYVQRTYPLSIYKPFYNLLGHSPESLNNMSPEKHSKRFQNVGNS